MTYSRETFQTTVSDMRARLEQTAEALSRQARSLPTSMSFIDAIGDAFQDVGNEVANVAENAVNTANALAEAMVQAAQETGAGATDATALAEAMIAAAAENTEAIADIASATVAVAALASELVSADERGAGGGAAPTGASAPELIEARRRAIRANIAQAHTRVAAVRKKIQRLTADFRARYPRRS